MKTKITLFLGLLITCQTWASDEHTTNSPFLKLYNAQKKVSFSEKISQPNFRQAYYAKQDMLPDTIKKYQYDDDSEKWELSNTQELIYNNDDLLIEEINYNGGDTTKVTIKYNQQARITEILTQKKIEGTFINVDKAEYLYDTVCPNLTILDVCYLWKYNRVWSLYYEYKTIINWNTYKNADSYIKTFRDKEYEDFLPYYKFEVTYGADQRANKVVYSIGGKKPTEWDESITYTDIVWNKWEENFTGDIFYQNQNLISARISPGNGQLNAVSTDTGYIVNIQYDNKKELVTYKYLDDRGSYEETKSYYILLGSEYVLNEGSKSKKIINEHIDISCFERSFYDNDKKAWILKDSTYYSYIYDDLGRISEMSVQYFSYNRGRWKYFYNGKVSIENEQKAIAHWTVYPNPGKDYFQLQGTQAIKELSIYTISGQQVRCLKNIAPEHKIDISNLPKGVYIISVKGDKTVETMRWVKM